MRKIIWNVIRWLAFIGMLGCLWASAARLPSYKPLFGLSYSMDAAIIASMLFVIFLEEFLRQK